MNESITENGKRMVKDNLGNWQQIQSREPIPRPEGESADCAYCTKKSSCFETSRHFYVGVKYPPCGFYLEVNKQMAEDERLKKLKEVFEPVPRPEGAAEDCLHCQKLKDRMGITCRHGPWQGRGKTCDNYHEITIRPERDQRHCIYCLKNHTCDYDRVKRIGTPCEKYEEYPRQN